MSEEKHTEKVECPECGHDQMAIVLHTFPWWSYVHECEVCGYMIMESEWATVKS